MSLIHLYIANINLNSSSFFVSRWIWNQCKYPWGFPPVRFRFLTTERPWNCIFQLETPHLFLFQQYAYLKLETIPLNVFLKLMSSSRKMSIFPLAFDWNSSVANHQLFRESLPVGGILDHKQNHLLLSATSCNIYGLGCSTCCLSNQFEFIDKSQNSFSESDRKAMINQWQSLHEYSVPHKISSPPKLCPFAQEEGPYRSIISFQYHASIHHHNQ